MHRIQLTVLLLSGALFVSACERSASPPKGVAPTPRAQAVMSPEEAALVQVTALYVISSEVRKNIPQKWKDLEFAASRMSVDSSEKMKDAVEKIKSLNYKVTWGIEKMQIFEKNIDPDDFVIFESPSGHLKSTYGGEILKADPSEKKSEPASEQTDTAKLH